MFLLKGFSYGHQTFFSGTTLFGGTDSLRTASHMDHAKFRWARNSSSASGLLSCCSPDDLLLKKGAHGKPELSGKYAGKIHFNLSHSGDQLALIFSVDSPVGIDIEKIHPVKKRVRIAERFFHPEETRLLKEASSADSEILFFRYWTMKEAFVKALGTGFPFRLMISSFHRSLMTLYRFTE